MQCRLYKVYALELEALIDKARSHADRPLMSGRPIHFNVASAQEPRANVTHRFGSQRGAWSIFVLNGRGQQYRTQGTGCFSLKWMVEGRAGYEIGCRRHMVARDTAMLVNHDQAYRMEFDPPAGGESFCIFFDPVLVDEAWASIEAGFNLPGEGRRREFPNVPFVLSQSFARVLSSLHKEGVNCDATLIESRLLLALEQSVLVARRHRGEAARIPAAKPSTRAHLLGLVERARERLTKANGVHFSLDSLADGLGVSKFHLLRLFKAVHGSTPGAYAERLRMEAAAAQLRSSARPVIDIALEFGYDSPSAFAKAFRRSKGSAPTGWRT